MVLVLPATQAQPADADAIFARSMASLESLSTLRVECETIINEQARLAFGGMPDTTTLFASDLPGSLRMEFVAGEGSGLVVVGDGELKIHDPAANRCVVVAAPAERDDVIMESLVRGGGAVSQGDVLFLPMMLLGAFEETYSQPKTYEGLETIDGVECHRLSMDAQGTSFHFWIQNTEAALPARVLVIVPEGQIPGTEGEVDLIDFRLINWDLAPTFADGTFEFAPPEGTEIVETLVEQPAAPDGTEWLGIEAPAFELSTLDGGTVKLEDLIGEKIVVLDFWATWCGPCIEALPIVTAVTAEFAEQGVELWAMNQGEDVDTIRAFLDEHGLNPQVALDSTGEVAGEYGVEGIPTTVIIGLDGTIQAYHIGFTPDYEEALRAELQALVDGQSLIEGPGEG